MNPDAHGEPTEPHTEWRDERERERELLLLRGTWQNPGCGGRLDEEELSEVLAGSSSSYPPSPHFIRFSHGAPGERALIPVDVFVSEELDPSLLLLLESLTLQQTSSMYALYFGPGLSVVFTLGG
ncbi:unnamed protein product [Pleuronectes platessa]|uniref:Uncharacterized protein n=1 Tax=Pleuronectes platessa TaxID=8262 RepID=A0A9N7TVB2_PLEPL|nr:unnamed protein product [Pleuronectes platessa]